MKHAEKFSFDFTINNVLSQDEKLDSYVLKLKKMFSGGKLEKYVRIFFLVIHKYRVLRSWDLIRSEFVLKWQKQYN